MTEKGYEREKMYVRPGGHGKLGGGLLYYGLPIQPSTSVWNLSDNIPNEVNDPSSKNLKRKCPTSVGTGMTAQEAHNEALVRLEKRVLEGHYDCIAVVSSLSIKSGAIFYCYVGAELYKFKERSWLHPVRGD
jgi:hypothetical protein